MADEKPTEWSLSKNQPIGNYGTKVDARLSTISPSNRRGYVLLSTTSKDSIINGDFVKLHYAIDNNGRVTYADIDDQGNTRRTYSNIQEIARSGKFGYTPETTLRIKDSLRVNLTQRTQSIILSSAATPVQPRPDPEGGNPGGNPQNQGNGESQPIQTPDEDLSVTPSDPFPTNIERKASSEISKPQLKYPIKLDLKEQDVVRFIAAELQKRAGKSIGSGNTNENLSFSFGTPVFDPVDGPVYLPINAPISDQNIVDWSPDSVNAIDAAVYGEAMKVIKGDPSGYAEQLQNFSANIAQTFKDNTGRIQRWAGGRAASINNILPRTDNIILNPNLELLFNGPQLRPFTFSFKLSARELLEAKEIKKIINYFKYHMAVRKGALFLKAPHVFLIDYLHKGQIHPGINRISGGTKTKACALTNFSVDYTPLGSYSTYTDGTMTLYTLSMQFQEIIPIYDEDYTDLDKVNFTEIGF